MARTAITASLIALSLGYIGYVVSLHIGELRGAGGKIQTTAMLLFVLLATASISLTTLYHVLLVPKLQPVAVSASQLGLAYAIGQLVRYLPGKVMGVVFEANFLRGRVNVATITLALLMQTVASYAWAGALATAILASAWLSDPWPFWLLAPAVTLLWLAHRHGWMTRAIAALPYAKRFMGSDWASPMDAKAANALTGVLLSNWLPFFAAWACLLHGRYTASESVVFGAAYLAASVISAAMIAVPSGIVVREALFIWVGHRFGLPLPDLLLYGIVLRLGLTIADMLNAGLYWAIDGFQRRGTHA